MGETMGQPWTEKHGWEAHGRLLELAAANARAGCPLSAIAPLFVYHVRDEAFFRECLRGAVPKDQIDAEVERVRDFAEGRRVRETTIEARRNEGHPLGLVAVTYTDLATGRRMASRWRRAGCRIFLVTRSRRASS